MSTESMVTQADRDAAAALIRQVKYHTEYLTEIEDGSYDENFFVQALARHRTAAQPEREAVLEEAAMIVDQFASGRRYCEPTEWDYGAQDALVVSAKTIRALKATPAPAVSTDEIVAVLERCSEMVDRNLHRQREKVEDVPRMLRQLASRLRSEP